MHMRKNNKFWASVIGNNVLSRPLDRHDSARTYFWKCSIFNYTYLTEGKM